MWFAPAAYDGTVWGRGGARVVTFADRAESIVVEFTGQQVELFRELSPSTALVPYENWRHIRSFLKRHPRRT